jgi:membrane protein implicated in regulation of membrane protease activity
MHIRWRIILPLGVLAGSFIFSWQLSLVLSAIYAFYFAASGWPRLQAMRRTNREMLCGTEWAYNRGCTPERLRMLKLPWSK